MSAANVALVQSLYAAFGRGDIATLIDGLASDIDWHVHGRPRDYLLIGKRRGKAEVEKFFQGVADNQKATDFSPKQFFATEDRVFVLGHYAWDMLKTGHHIDCDWVHVFTVRNGKVTEFQEFTDTAQYAEASRK